MKEQGLEGGELARRWAEVTEHRANLRSKWAARLRWVPEDVDVWRGILAVRSLVLKPREVWTVVVLLWRRWFVDRCWPLVCGGRRGGGCCWQ